MCFIYSGWGDIWQPMIDVHSYGIGLGWDVQSSTHTNYHNHHGKPTTIRWRSLLVWSDEMLVFVVREVHICPGVQRDIPFFFVCLLTVLHCGKVVELVQNNTLFHHYSRPVNTADTCLICVDPIWSDWVWNAAKTKQPLYNYPILRFSHPTPYSCHHYETHDH